MNTNVKSEPPIRFPGFTDPWEQRKVGEIANKTFGGGTPKTNVPEYWNGNIPWIQSSNLSEHQLFDVDIQKHITTKGLQKSATQLVPKNSIAVVSHVGVGKLVFMPFEYTTSQDFISLADLNTDPTFSCYALYKKLQDDLHIVQGSAIKGITKEVLLNKEISVPKFAEQKKIGEVLRSMDNLITLHQRKCDELKNYKKGLLQQIFPQPGESIPRVRFPGFTDLWEQRKLGEVTQSIKNGYNYKSDGNRNYTYKITRIETISSGTINPERLGSSDDVNQNYLLQDGDILFSHINSLPYIGNTAIYTNNLGPLYHGMNLLNIRTDKEIVDPFFLLYVLKNERSRNWFRMTAKPAVNQASIPVSDLSEFVFCIPNIEEQRRISSLLIKLDDTITLHQRKCDELKNYKKGLLQNMFV